MDVVILAGGKSTRMEDRMPKPLIQAKGKPILAHQLDYLLNFKDVDNIIISLGHLAEDVMDYVQAQYPNTPIQFVVEDTPLGTGGAMRLALQKTQSSFVIALNCDDITNIPIEELAELKENHVCVAHPRLPYGLVKEKEGYAFFQEKPLLSEWVSCGWYVFNRTELLEHLPDEGSIEYEVFPKIKLRLYKHKGLWAPLNTKKDIAEFEKS